MVSIIITLTISANFIAGLFVLKDLKNFPHKLSFFSMKSIIEVISLDLILGSLLLKKIWITLLVILFCIIIITIFKCGGGSND